jgi:hypothetical protein
MKYTINTLADHQDAISNGLYLDFNQQEQAFDYCGPYEGLMVAMQGLRDAGAEFSHRVDRVMDTGDALEAILSETNVRPFVSLSGLSEDYHATKASSASHSTSFSLHNVWGSV